MSVNMSTIGTNNTLFEIPVDFNGTGKTISSSIDGYVIRLSNQSTADQYPGSILVTDGDCHIQQDTLGSASELGKWS